MKQATEHEVDEFFGAITEDPEIDEPAKNSKKDILEKLNYYKKEYDKQKNNIEILNKNLSVLKKLKRQLKPIIDDNNKILGETNYKISVNYNTSFREENYKHALITIYLEKEE